ncbi:hypothetical protein ABDK00_015890 [Niabella insulamsoli]|uniref:hypothetical protein n=1 Tax=Niabella insulamsoli TaxID=3144874 RepID=UPI0031FD28A1
MDFKKRILSQIQEDYSLSLSASHHFKEPLTYIENAIDLITDATVDALNKQFDTLGKIDEIFKIGKECSILNWAEVFDFEAAMLQKGRGINSEIFGVKLVDTIDDIAQKANVRNKTINFLMATTTPVILSLFHTLTTEEYSPLEFFHKYRNKKFLKAMNVKYGINLKKYARSIFNKK